MGSNWPLLSLLIWLPILGGAATLAFGRERAEGARWFALLVAAAVLALCVPLYSGFDSASAAMQFTERAPWIPSFSIFYHLGVDGISVALIALTAITTVLVIIGAWRSVEERVHQYLAAMLVLEGVMIGVFAAMDAMLFYVFFDAMLIPMFIII